MKQKRLIVIFSIFFVVVLLIVLSSTVFTLQSVRLIFKNENNEEIPVPERFQSLKPSTLAEGYVGQNIFFLSKKDMQKTIEKKEPFLKILGISTAFPNRADIYATVRVPLLEFTKDASKIVTDSDGFVFPSSSLEGGQRYVSIGGFRSDDFATVEDGATISWSEQGAAKFVIVKTAMHSLWEHEYNYNEIALKFTSVSVDENTLSIHTLTGAVLVAKYADRDLKSKINALLSVYMQSDDNKGPGITITVTGKDSSPIVSGK